MRPGAVVIDSLFGSVVMLSQLHNSCGVKCGGRWLYIVNSHRCKYLEGGGHKKVKFALEQAMRVQSMGAGLLYSFFSLGSRWRWVIAK
jgi:hypothetical protein